MGRRFTRMFLASVMLLASSACASDGIESLGKYTLGDGSTVEALSITSAHPDGSSFEVIQTYRTLPGPGEESELQASHAVTDRGLARDILSGAVPAAVGGYFFKEGMRARRPAQANSVDVEVEVETCNAPKSC